MLLPFSNSFSTKNGRLRHVFPSVFITFARPLRDMTVRKTVNAGTTLGIIYIKVYDYK